MKIYYSTVLLLVSLLTFSTSSLAQTTDSTLRQSPQPDRHLRGAVSITNNGISFIPTFSLGKPAVIFDMSMGGKRLSFEPQLRFGLDGKPWSFLFWWRYKLVTTKKLRISIGTHPALNFSTTPMTATNGDVKEIIETRRFAAGEISPNYVLSKNVSVGMYYLYGHGFDQGGSRNAHFVTVNSNISNIPLSRNYFLQVVPQFFYLNVDSQDGFYFTSTATLSKRNFPLSLSAIINKVLKTNIAGSKDFVWNTTLIYAFNKNYVRQ